MRIADGLLLQKDIAEEVARLRSLAKTEAWEYRSTDPNAKWVPTFDLEENMKEVKRMSKLQRKLSRAVTKTNNATELLDINDTNYSEWL